MQGLPRWLEGAVRCRCRTRMPATRRYQGMLHRTVRAHAIHGTVAQRSHARHHTHTRALGMAIRICMLTHLAIRIVCLSPQKSSLAVMITNPPAPLSVPADPSGEFVDRLACHRLASSYVSAAASPAEVAEPYQTHRSADRQRRQQHVTCSARVKQTTARKTRETKQIAYMLFTAVNAAVNVH